MTTPAVSDRESLRLCFDFAQMLPKMQNSAPNSKRCSKGAQRNRERPNCFYYTMKSNRTNNTKFLRLTKNSTRLLLKLYVSSTVVKVSFHYAITCLFSANKSAAPTTPTFPNTSTMVTYIALFSVPARMLIPVIGIVSLRYLKFLSFGVTNRSNRPRKEQRQEYGVF